MCRVRIQDIEVVDEVYRYAIESHDGSQYFIDFD